MTAPEPDLDVIEARAAAATASPWAWSYRGEAPASAAWQLGPMSPPRHGLVNDADDKAILVEEVCAGDGFNPSADADFIAHAREDVPALVAEARRLRAELAAEKASREKAEAGAAAMRSALRPVVWAFALSMESKLRANDHKGGWRNDAPGDLLRRLREETEEVAAFGGQLLGAAVRHDERPDDPSHKASVADEIGGECADVANFAMMIAERCGALKRHALASDAGAALLERLNLAELQVVGLVAEAHRLNAEIDRLAAQLLQDAPIAAAARAYQRAHDARWSAEDRSPVASFGERRDLIKGQEAAEDAHVDLARAQREGGE